MSRINIILTLLSVNAVLIIVERLSFTTRIILQPYSFLRLHEVLQMSVIILISVILPFFLLKELSDNFALLKTRKGMLLGVLFITGLYFYSTGNGLHEVASHLFNTFCNTKRIATLACGSMFFNDYYFGNILYFFGALLNSLALVGFELMKPVKNFSRSDEFVTIVNAMVYAFMLFLYAAFDRVLVGLWFTVISAVIVDALLIVSKKKYREVPFTLYSAIAYTLSAICTGIFRLH